MHKSECQITERREWIVQSTSNLLRLLLYSKTYNLKLGLKWAMQTIYSYKLCYYFLVICKNFAASQDSNYTDSNVNSSMVETVKHFLEDFHPEYEKNAVKAFSFIWSSKSTFISKKPSKCKLWFTKSCIVIYSTKW